MAKLIEPLYVRPSVAAKLISVSRSKLYEMLHSGELEAITIGGLLRVPMAGIEALREKRAKPTIEAE